MIYKVSGGQILTVQSRTWSHQFCWGLPNLHLQYLLMLIISLRRHIENALVSVSRGGGQVGQIHLVSIDALTFGWFFAKKGRFFGK